MPWGMDLDMPHPCVRRYSTENSVTKELYFSTPRERTLLFLTQNRNICSKQAITLFPLVRNERVFQRC